jgi:hypothetical protein
MSPGQSSRSFAPTLMVMIAFWTAASPPLLAGKWGQSTTTTKTGDSPHFPAARGLALVVLLLSCLKGVWVDSARSHRNPVWDAEGYARVQRLLKLLPPDQEAVLGVLTPFYVGAEGLAHRYAWLALKHGLIPPDRITRLEADLRAGRVALVKENLLDGFPWEQELRALLREHYVYRPELGLWEAEEEYRIQNTEFRMTD